MVGIYKIINPKGKIYIGQSINIESRKRVYFYFNSYKNSIGPVLTNSFKKYGFENHIFEVIEECSIEQLNDFEYLNKKYKELESLPFSLEELDLNFWIKCITNGI